MTAKEASNNVTLVASPTAPSTTARTRREDDLEVDGPPTIELNLPIMLTPLPAKGVE